MEKKIIPDGFDRLSGTNKTFFDILYSLNKLKT